MKKYLKISFDKFLPSISEDKLFEYNRLIKSINSLNNKVIDFQFYTNFKKQEISFTQDEIEAAIKRLEKDENNNQYLDFLPFDRTTKKTSIFDSLYEKTELKLSKEELVSIHPELDIYPLDYLEIQNYDDFDFNSFITELSIKSDESAKSLLGELYFRRTKRILVNILSSSIKLRRLIAIHSPIKEITYEYFDLISSLKKEVGALRKLNFKSSNNPFYEKIYIRNLQTLNRA